MGCHRATGEFFHTRESFGIPMEKVKQSFLSVSSLVNLHWEASVTHKPMTSGWLYRSLWDTMHIARNFPASALVQSPECDQWVTGQSSKDLPFVPPWVLLITVISHDGSPWSRLGLPGQALDGCCWTDSVMGIGRVLNIWHIKRPPLAGCFI